METWKIILGVAFALFCLGLLVWKTVKYVRRGWKDHRWIWDDAHRAARLVAFVMACKIGVDAVRYGFDFRVWVTLWVALVFVIGPYVAYTTGRLLGIWHRSRQGRVLR
jgi:hypothetical protein